MQQRESARPRRRVVVTGVGAVTPVGRHISISRYGYRPLRSADDDILVREPTAAMLETAA